MGSAGEAFGERDQGVMELLHGAIVVAPGGAIVGT
jgi:hypothetical protein